MAAFFRVKLNTEIFKTGDSLTLTILSENGKITFLEQK